MVGTDFFRLKKDGPSGVPKAIDENAPMNDVEMATPPSSSSKHRNDDGPPIKTLSMTPMQIEASNNMGPLGHVANIVNNNHKDDDEDDDYKKVNGMHKPQQQQQQQLSSLPPPPPQPSGFPFFKKARSNVSSNGSNSSARGHGSGRGSSDPHNPSDTDSFKSLRRMAGAGTLRITILILFMGFCISGAFLGLGISSAVQAQTDAFDRNAIDLVNKINTAWNDYVNAASMIHARCRKRTFARQDFRYLYEYLRGGGLDFQAAQFDPNITRDERAYYEEEAREFYATYYPHVQYRGIIGFETAESKVLEPRSEQDFYFPIHYMGMYTQCRLFLYMVCLCDRLWRLGECSVLRIVASKPPLTFYFVRSFSVLLGFRSGLAFMVVFPL